MLYKFYRMSYNKNMYLLKRYFKINILQKCKNVSSIQAIILYYGNNIVSIILVS